MANEPSRHGGRSAPEQGPTLETPDTKREETRPSSEPSASASTSPRGPAALSSARSAPLDFALAAARRGYRVFPWRYVDNRKVPHVKGWQTVASRDPEVIATWWRRWPKARTGAPTGELVVVDLDVKGDKEGIATWGQWCAEHDITPRHHAVTPSKGRHTYYRSDERLTNRGDVLPGVDVRAYGGWAGLYTLPPALDTLEELPAAAVELFRTREVASVPIDDDRPGDAWHHAHARVRAEAALARLPRYGKESWEGHWDGPTWQVAADLIQLAQSPWADLDIDELHERFLDAAPTDQGFTLSHAEAKWASALSGKAGLMVERPSSPAEDFPDDLPEEDEGGPLAELFAASDQLRHVQRAAHSRLLSAPMLLANVLALALWSVPPNWALPPVVGSRGALNLAFAVVGTSSAGKSASMDTALELMGLGDGLTRGLGSGEGLIDAYLEKAKQGEPAALIPDPRWLFTADEIETVGKMMERSGASLGGYLKTAVSGGKLSTSNAKAGGRDRNVAAGSYRFVAILNVQPALSGYLLEGESSGLPQRFLWVGADDSTRPPSVEACPTWPGLLPARAALDDEGRRELDYPRRIKDEVRQGRWEEMRPGSDVSMGHLRLTRLKTAAALALLHGEASISERWWTWAGVLVDMSMTTMLACKRHVAQEALAVSKAAGRHQAVRDEGAAEHRGERVRKAALAIARLVHAHETGAKDANQKHEPGEGCTRRCVTRALGRQVHDETLRGAALAYAEGERWIVQGEGERWRAGDEI